jgi:hypothetical protein
MGLKIVGLKVRSLDVDYRELSWETESLQADALDYAFQVLRSEAVQGPWDEISQPFSDQYIFRDNATLTANNNRTLFYKIRVIKKVDNSFEDSDAVSQEAEADLITREIRRHMNLLYREFIGRRCVLLPVRTFGQRCSCWSKTRNSKLRSGCQLCWDTGYLRGYMTPIEGWVQIEPNAKAQQNSSVGPMQQENTTARCGQYLHVKNNDVIVEPENIRWRVVSTVQTEHVRAGLHQELQLHRIPSSDIEYAIPINWNEALKDLFLSPSRNFTNPTNLENFENDEIPGIFNLYPTTYPDPRR